MNAFRQFILIGFNLNAWPHGLNVSKFTIRNVEISTRSTCKQVDYTTKLYLSLEVDENLAIAVSF